MNIKPIWFLTMAVSFMAGWIYHDSLPEPQNHYHIEYNGNEPRIGENEFTSYPYTNVKDKR